MGFMSFLQPMLGFASAMMANGTQKDIAAMQVDVANKNRASENMRHAENLQMKGTENQLDTQFRNTQNRQDAFNELIGVMRDSFLRSPRGG